MLREPAHLDMEGLRNAELLNELARVFGNRALAYTVLGRIGFPQELMPDFGIPMGFWLEVCNAVADGLTPGGLPALLSAAADVFPYNARFAPWREERSKPGSRPDTGSSILITGPFDVPTIMARARVTAQAQHLGEVELGVATDQRLQLRLPNANPEQAYGLAQELRQSGVRTEIVPNQFRDYLLESLLVEGPDTRRWELNDVPASTRGRDVARAAMSQYGQEMWPQDRSGHARPAVVDLLTPEGATRRLEPDATLHDSGVEDHASVHVAPESTAGINPHIREEALARVRAQVVAFATSHTGFEVEANSVHAPTEYMLRFEAPGWGPPAEPGEQPYPVDIHAVFLQMPPEFPMMAPIAYWQTPIYHPNIHRPSGKVCLGALEDRYRPGLDFGELCQVLMDFASYQNYEITEGYDEEARNWAVSPEGQVAIEQRGGKSVLRQLLTRFQEETQEPIPLRIRPLQE